VQITERCDIVFSQALTALLTAFIADALAHNPVGGGGGSSKGISSSTLFWQQVVHVGYLAVFESLLSTLGSELGMLEDYHVGVDSLSRVRLRVVDPRHFPPSRVLGLSSIGDGAVGVGVDIQPHKAFLKASHLKGVSAHAHEGSKGADYMVSVCLGHSFNYGGLPTVLSAPPGMEGRGEEVSFWVVPVLVTQGINERQSFANAMHKEAVQHRINAQAADALRAYVEDCVVSCPRALATGASEALERFEDAVQVAGTKHAKSTAILATVEPLTRLLRGGRLTSCKSAKDRTSMSVTLEQAQAMDVECGGLRDAQDATRTLRIRGARRQNVERNIGARRYAFNAIQRKALPKAYRPPDGTAGGGGAS
jgi:inositol polyphosphate-4-phosphatase